MNQLFWASYPIISYRSHFFALQESKTAAKLWVFINYFFVVALPAIVLAASQKNDTLFNSLTMTSFLIFACVDFFLLLYFLWIIIVYLKEAIDMPGL